MIRLATVNVRKAMKRISVMASFSEAAESKGLNPHLYDHLNLFLKAQKQNAPVPPRLKASDMNLGKIIALLDKKVANKRRFC